MIEITVVRRLSNELAAATRQVEAADPDAPAWEAEIRIPRLLAGISSITSRWHLQRRRVAGPIGHARNEGRPG